MVFRLKRAFEAHVINDLKLIKMRNSFMDFVGDSAFSECSFDSIPITTGVFVIFLVQLCGYFCYFQTRWSELTKNELHDFFLRAVM